MIKYMFPSTASQSTESSQATERLSFKQNNFDLLRLLFALIVCLVHVYKLSENPQLAWLHRVLSSDLAIQAFFVVSGFLIFRSYEQSSSLKSYISKRARRIYPAYFVVILLSAFGLFFASSVNVEQYFSFEWLRYVLVNLFFLNFLQHTLPGVFESNLLPAVNGALWTLKIEVMFYISVPFFVLLFNKLPRHFVLLFFYAASVLYLVICNYLADLTGDELYRVLGRQLPGQLSYFLAGAALFYYLAYFERYAALFLTVAVLILIANQFFVLPALQPLALSVLVVYLGMFHYLGNFGKFGDFSYGVYIFHFPIIQLLLLLQFFRVSPWWLLLISVAATFIAAFASWHLIEKRFLHRSSHYMKTIGRSA